MPVITDPYDFSLKMMNYNRYRAKGKRIKAGSKLDMAMRDVLMKDINYARAAKNHHRNRALVKHHLEKFAELWRITFPPELLAPPLEPQCATAHQLTPKSGRRRDVHHQHTPLTPKAFVAALRRYQNHPKTVNGKGMPIEAQRALWRYYGEKYTLADAAEKEGVHILHLHSYWRSFIQRAGVPLQRLDPEVQ